MEKLISMCDFVLKQLELLKSQKINILQFRNRIETYAGILKQELKVGMFAPCDENDNFLIEPEYYEHYSDKNVFWNWEESIFSGFLDDEEDYNDWMRDCSKYYKAKQNVLFDEFEFTYNSEVIKVLEDKSKNKIIFSINDPVCTIEHISFEGTIKLTKNVISKLT